MSDTKTYDYANDQQRENTLNMWIVLQIAHPFMNWCLLPDQNFRELNFESNNPMILGVHYTTCQPVVEMRSGYSAKWHIPISPHLSEKLKRERQSPLISINSLIYHTVVPIFGWIEYCVKQNVLSLCRVLDVPAGKCDNWWTILKGFIPLNHFLFCCFKKDRADFQIVFIWIPSLNP